MTTWYDIFNMRDTWNNAGTVFSSIFMNVSNGADGAPVCADGSKILQLQNNKVDVFTVDPSGASAVVRSVQPISFATRTAAVAATIPASVTRVWTGGYYTEGDGGGALYARIGSQPGHAIWFQSADGAYWTWADIPGTFNILHAGAKPDGSFTFGTYAAWTGTDNATAIQNAIDAHVIFKLDSQLFFPNGLYLISKGLHVGYGCGGFTTAQFRGSGINYRGQFIGPTLLCNFTTMPGVNFSGMREADWDGIGLVGLNMAWCYIQNLGSTLGTLGGAVDDLQAVNWLDPAILATNPNAGGRYTPYAAFAVDGYAGAQPSPSYPTVSYPSYAGATFGVQYNKAFSSDINLRNIYIAGFDTAIVTQPSGADGNGDFLKVERGLIEGCKYGISISQNQSRNVCIRNVNVASMFCMFTNSVHGSQQGSFGGVIENCSGSTLINLFIFGSTSVAGTLRFVSGYFEAIWCIGSIQGGSSSELLVKIEQCSFAFTLQSDSVRGAPAYLISGNTLSSVPISFEGGLLNNFLSVAVFQTVPAFLNMDTTLLLPQSARTNPYEKFAHNVLGGGLVTSLLGTSTSMKNIRIRPKYSMFNVDTGAVANVQVVYSPQACNRSLTPCMYVDQLVESVDIDGPGINYIAPIGWLDVTGITAASLSSKILTFTLPASFLSSNKLFNYGPLPGDVIYDPSSGTVFFVNNTNTGTGVVVAVQQNNYRGVAGGYAPINAVLLNSGAWYVINSRFYVPEYYTMCSITSGSASVTAVGRGDGYGNYIGSSPGGIVNGDAVWIDQHRDFWGSLSANVISVVSAGSPGSFTMGHTANYSATMKRLGLFVRPGSANI